MHSLVLQNMKHTLCKNTENSTKLSLHYSKEFLKKSAPLIMSVTTVNLTEHLCHTNPSKVPCLLQKIAKVLVAMQVVVHLKVVISSVIQVPWAQNKCKQFQLLVTFSNKTEHRTLLFLEKFFFPCCDQKSDSEVNHHKIKQKYMPTHTHTQIFHLYIS